MKNTITFEFETEEAKEDFSAWLLDGGGEDDYGNFLEMHEKDFVSFKQKDGSWDEILVES